MDNRPTLWDISDFIDELGFPQDVRHELIEVSGEKGFEFYMLVFHTRHDTEESSDDETSIAVFWPKEKLLLRPGD